MKKMINGIAVEIVKGNIVRQKDIDIIVNAANARLQSGGGVAGAVHAAAGPELGLECSRLAPIKPGEAAITKAYRLPNKHIIHCLGPVYGVDEPASVLLANCYRNALKTAEQKKVVSIAFPAISAGVFGYPFEDAADVALRTVLDALPGLRRMQLIRFVLFTKADKSVYEAVFSLLLAEAKKM